MGLGDLSPEGAQESSGGKKSTYVSFKNPDHPEVELEENTAYRHKREYYKSVQRLRDIMSGDINVVFGKFAYAAVQANDEGNNEPLEELFNQITE